MGTHRPIAAQLDAVELGGRFHTTEGLDDQLGVDRLLAGEVAQAGPAIAPERDVSVVVRAGALRSGPHLGQHRGHALHRVLGARILEVDPDLVHRGRRLGVLLFDRGDDQRRLAARADD